MPLCNRNKCGIISLGRGDFGVKFFSFFMAIWGVDCFDFAICVRFTESTHPLCPHPQGRGRLFYRNDNSGAFKTIEVFAE